MLREREGDGRVMGAYMFVFLQLLNKGKKEVKKCEVSAWRILVERAVVR